MLRREICRHFFTRSTAAAAALGLAGPPSGVASMTHSIRVTCGIQYAAAEKEPGGCAICLDG